MRQFFLCETFTDRPTWSSGSDRCVCQHSPTTTESLCHTKASQVYMLGNGIIADLLLPARSVVCRNEWDSRWNILSRAEDLNARFGRLRFLLMKQFFLLLDDICWLVWILEEFFIVYSVFSSSSLSAFFLTSAHTMFFISPSSTCFFLLPGTYRYEEEEKSSFLLRYDFYCASWWAKKLHELCVCEHEAPRERESGKLVENLLLWQRHTKSNDEAPAVSAWISRRELHSQQCCQWFSVYLPHNRFETQLRVAGESFVWAYGKSKLFFGCRVFDDVTRCTSLLTKW